MRHDYTIMDPIEEAVEAMESREAGESLSYRTGTVISRT